MKRTDIAIVGGGAAGSAAAAMLARAGIDFVLIDPHPVYPPDFRCEKLDASQQDLLRRAGLEAVLDATTSGGEVRVVRMGRLLDMVRHAPRGVRYDDLVNRLRAEIPSERRLVATATEIAEEEGRQRITLSTGERVSARLVVVANGLNMRLRRSLGIGQEEVSRCHSVSVGFDLAPADRADFGFSALTYYPEHVGDRIAYLTLFRVGAAMRANLFVYWAPDDPRLATLREMPDETLAALLPNLARHTGPFRVVPPVKVRPVDLTVSTGLRRAGIVLIGDAFATSCPAAGTGLNKVLTDVERLCAVHIPRWLESDGMGSDKIAAFYDDPVKRDCDRDSTDKAFRLRTLSTETGFRAEARRWSRFVGHLGRGAIRMTGERFAAFGVFLASML